MSWGTPNNFDRDQAIDFLNRINNDSNRPDFASDEQNSWFQQGVAAAREQLEREREADARRIRELEEELRREAEAIRDKEIQEMRAKERAEERRVEEERYREMREAEERRREYERWKK